MAQFLLQIRIVDYKSFVDETILLDGVTCIVGANETGKTNLLKAIRHLSKEEQNKPFSPDDVRKGSLNYPLGTMRITYFLRLEKILIPELINLLPQLEGKTAVLEKSGQPNLPPKWICELKIGNWILPEIVTISNKLKFRTSLKTLVDKAWTETSINCGWFIKDNATDLRRNPYFKLLKEGAIKHITKEEKMKLLAEEVLKSVLQHANIYFWKYEEKDFLQETVTLNEFIQNPDNFPTVRDMFVVAGWKVEEFATKLQNQTPGVYSQLLGQEVKREIDNLIKNNWSSHKNLEIKIEHRGDHLAIHLDETGSSTPPEFRSDGLKWFLTFLIRFRARSATLSNYILLIDEPGLFLHPRGQKDVLDELENLSKENQIIYTTHQTFLINKNQPNRVRVLKRELERSGNLVRNPFYASKVYNEIDTRKILTDKLLREALGFKVSDISPINEKNILVEGVFDRDLFHYLNEKWKIIDLNEVSIIACGPASEIVKHAKLYVANDLKVACFYDSDEPGKRGYENNDAVRKDLKRQIRNYIRQKEYETIEDVLPDFVFDEAFSEWCQKWNLSQPQTIVRPRMKQINSMMTDSKKSDMKHELEDLLLNETKKEFTRRETEFGKFKEILSDLNTRVNH